MSTSGAIYIVQITGLSGRTIFLAVNAYVGILGDKFIPVIILIGVDNRASVSTLFMGAGVGCISDTPDITPSPGF